jgi:hypothetical protein
VIVQLDTVELCVHKHCALSIAMYRMERASHQRFVNVLLNGVEFIVILLFVIQLNAIMVRVILQIFVIVMWDGVVLIAPFLSVVVKMEVYALLPIYVTVPTLVLRMLYAPHLVVIRYARMEAYVVLLTLVIVLFHNGLVQHVKTQFVLADVIMGIVVHLQIALATMDGMDRNVKLPFVIVLVKTAGPVLLQIHVSVQVTGMVQIVRRPYALLLVHLIKHVMLPISVLIYVHRIVIMEYAI